MTDEAISRPADDRVLERAGTEVALESNVCLGSEKRPGWFKLWSVPGNAEAQSLQEITAFINH